MIGRLQGKILQKQPPAVLVDVNGIGYDVQVPMSTIYDLPEVGLVTTLLIHTYVREDALVLYGFGSESERALFRQLIKISGVGAKMALALLSGISVRAFSNCVGQDDVATLIKLPGVGKKTAERLIIEMKDKITASEGATESDFVSETPGKTSTQEAEAALVALGYKPAEAARMIGKVRHQTKDASIENLIKCALQASVQNR